MNRTIIVTINVLVSSLFVGVTSTAYAAIPATYKGTPFDPAVAGGTFNGMPTSSITTAGPYAIPGRLEFENYDMGGDTVGYHTTDHIGCVAAMYRKDGTNTASLCATSPMADTKYPAPNGDVYYDTGTALDGTTYPNAATMDVYIGAVRPGDWVNITVNVMTAATYVVSSTWASGNGNPGGEGGNGAMELQVFSNGTMLLDWKDTFPNYNTTANFHNWKTYANMGTVTLQAGLQVIKLQSPDPHLNLDYVQFSLPGVDGGTDAAAGAGGGTGGAGGGPGAGDAGAATGAAGTNGAGGEAGAGATGGTTGATGAAGAGTAGAGSTGTGAAGQSGVTGGAGTTSTSGAGGAGTPPKRASGGGCSLALASEPTGAGGAMGATIVGAAMALARIRARRRRRQPRRGDVS